MSSTEQLFHDKSINIYPETAPLIAHARSQSSGQGPELPYSNIGSLLAARSCAYPAKEWLTFYDDGGRAASYTYVEFEREARRVAGLMAGPLGIQAGERVATLMSNDPRTVLIYFGAWLIGATVVPVNRGEDDERVAYILRNSQAAALFAAEAEMDRCAELAPGADALRHILQVGGPPRADCLSFDEAVAAQPPLETLPDLPAHTESLIVYTSGTTGPPKGVVLEQSNMLADAQSIAAWHRFGEEDRAMCVLPIHHVNGTIVTLVTPLFSGGSVVLNSRFRAQSFWRTLSEEQCTWCSVVPTVLAFLCERHEDLGSYDLMRFRHIICGAGPLTVELARRFDEAFGVRVVHGYGLSETTCYSCFLPMDLDPAAYRHWMTECGFPSIGCPIACNEMSIHDPEGRPLAPDERGEIVIRGSNVMKYYFARPDINLETFAHGWFRSGDEGFYRVGEDGLPYYFITGRIKELIVRGGVKYSPFDIDEVLTRIPGVKAAMAVGFDNDFYGEEVGAYVQREDAAIVSDAEILAACREELPFAKSPKVVVFGEEFPVTSTGKYQRNRLKPLFAQWRAVQFRDK